MESFCEWGKSKDVALYFFLGTESGHVHMRAEDEESFYHAVYEAMGSKITDDRLRFIDALTAARHAATMVLFTREFTGRAQAMLLENTQDVALTVHEVEMTPAVKDAEEMRQKQIRKAREDAANRPKERIRRYFIKMRKRILKRKDRS